MSSFDPIELGELEPFQSVVLNIIPAQVKSELSKKTVILVTAKGDWKSVDV